MPAGAGPRLGELKLAQLAAATDPGLWVETAPICAPPASSQRSRSRGVKLPVSAAYWKDAVTWSPSLAGKRSLLSVRSAALKASFSMKGVGQLACAPVPPLAMTVNSPGTATPFQPVKSPVAKLPFETTAPASARASILPTRPAITPSAATRKPVSSLIAAVLAAIWPPRVVATPPTAVAIPASVWTRV